MMNKEDRAVISQAKKILEGLFKTKDLLATNPEAVMDYCQLNIAHLESEAFGVLFLNNQNRLIKKRILFNGTIDGCAVYPREVVKEVLRCNAASVIYFHNHPSGSLHPSEQDKVITKRLSDALTLIDVRSLDHIIVTSKGSVSMAQLGLL